MLKLVNQFLILVMTQEEHLLSRGAPSSPVGEDGFTRVKPTDGFAPCLLGCVAKKKLIW